MTKKQLSDIEFELLLSNAKEKCEALKARQDETLPPF
jgi:hypothetical protein